MRHMYILAVTITAILSYNLSFGQELSGEGIIFPAMAIYPSSPVEGQVIYFTGTNPDEYQYFDGSNWLPLSPTGGGGATDMIMDLVNGDGRVKVLNGGTNNDAITFDLNGLQKMSLHHNSGNPKLLLSGDLQLFDNTGAIEFWENSAIKSELDFDGSTLSLKNTETNGDLNLETTGDDIFLSTGDDIFFRQGGITKALMNQDGDLGLGTTNPAAKLQVNHSASEADPNLYINGIGGGAARIRMSSNSTSEYWQQYANSLTDPKMRFTYRDGGVTNSVLTLDGDSKFVGINDATPAAALQIDGPLGEDVFRARLGTDTRLMVHDNGSISVGSSTAGHEGDLARFAVPIRMVPQSSETCSASNDVGKMYFDTEEDKLKVCVRDNNIFLPGDQTGWVNLH